MDEYLVPFEAAESEFTEKRSRFLSHIWRVESEEEARARIEEMKKTYYDARHNCWCYLLQKGGTVRYSDDGEPQGTAGQPMLNVFQRAQVWNVCCVVTRYFGGILLGGGGLVRAYSHAARLAVDAAGIVEMRRCLQLEVRCDYAQYGFLPALLAAENARITDTRYDDGVTVQFTLEANRRGALAAALTERSAGRLTLTALGEIFAPFPVAAEE